MSGPELVVVGGPNGSGKTTFAREQAARTGIRYLGADDIAAELRPAHPEQAAIAAARTFAARLDEALTSRQSVVVESTLAGRSLQRALVNARAQGYRITVIFVFLDSPELCLARIAERVAQGGHNVPEADVRRRFGRSMRNFWRLYRFLSSEWELFYNAGQSFEPVVLGNQTETFIVDETLFHRWQEMVAEGSHHD